MNFGSRRGDLIRLPPVARGMRIGLYGGSFDPPHAGHRHVALIALKRLNLDRVWWVVGPGNPLKDQRNLPSSEHRLAAARSVARHPKMIVTGFEAELAARFSVDTIRYLVRRCPTVHFVWIIGADSFAIFHRWRAWRHIAALVPIAVIDRPGWTLRAQNGKVASALRRGRVSPRSAAVITTMKPPAWTFISGPRSNLSSTALRDKLLKRLDRR